MGFIIETTHELLHDLIITVTFALDQPREGSVKGQHSGNHCGLPGYQINKKQEQNPHCGKDGASQPLKHQTGHKWVTMVKISQWRSSVAVLALSPSSATDWPPLFLLSPRFFQGFFCLFLGFFFVVVWVFLSEGFMKCPLSCANSVMSSIHLLD